MSEKNYISILIESLEKKRELLMSIREENDKQVAVLEKPDFDDEAFDATLEAKDRLITKLRFVDDGFESVYKRVKDELVNNKSAHAAEIKTMQGLITEITELSTSIQTSEKRNESALTTKFRAERQKLKQSKATVQAVTGYYQSMSGTNIVESRFLDQKQ